MAHINERRPSIEEVVEQIEQATDKMDDAATLAFLDELKERIELMADVARDGELPGPNAPEDVPEELKLEE